MNRVDHARVGDDRVAAAEGRDRTDNPLAYGGSIPHVELGAGRRARDGARAGAVCVTRSHATVGGGERRDDRVPTAEYSTVNFYTSIPKYRTRTFLADTDLRKQARERISEHPEPTHLQHIVVCLDGSGN
jgi:hypothetical protein